MVVLYKLVPGAKLLGALHGTVKPNPPPLDIGKVPKQQKATLRKKKSYRL